MPTRGYFKKKFRTEVPVTHPYTIGLRLYRGEKMAPAKRCQTREPQCDRSLKLGSRLSKIETFMSHRLRKGKQYEHYHVA